MLEEGSRSMIFTLLTSFLALSSSHQIKAQQRESSSSSSSSLRGELYKSASLYDDYLSDETPSWVLDEKFENTGSNRDEHNLPEERNLLFFPEPVTFDDYDCQGLLVETFGDTKFEYETFVLMEFNSEVLLTQQLVDGLARLLHEAYLLQSGNVCDRYFRSIYSNSTMELPDVGSTSHSVIFQMQLQGFVVSSDSLILEDAFDSPDDIVLEELPPVVYSSGDCDVETQIFNNTYGDTDLCLLNGCYCNLDSDNVTALYESDVAFTIDTELQLDPKFSGLDLVLHDLRELYQPTTVSTWTSDTFYMAMVFNVPLISLSPENKTTISEAIMEVANSINFENCDPKCRRITEVTLDNGDPNGPSQRRLSTDATGHLFPYEIVFEAAEEGLTFFDPETHDASQRRAKGERSKGIRRIKSAVKDILETSSKDCWCPKHVENPTLSTLSVSTFEMELREKINEADQNIELEKAWVVKEESCPPLPFNTFSTKIVVKMKKKYKNVGSSNLAKLNSACIRGYNIFALENCQDQFYRVTNCTFSPLYPELDVEGKTRFAEVEIFYSCYGCSEQDSLFGYPGAPGPNRQLEEDEYNRSLAQSLALMDLDFEDHRLLFLRTDRCWCTADTGNGLKPRKRDMVEVLNATLNGNIARVIDTVKQEGSRCSEVVEFTEEVECFFDVEPLASELEELGSVFCDTINELYQETCDTDFLFCTESALGTVRRLSTFYGSSWSGSFFTFGYVGASSESYFSEQSFRRNLLTSRFTKRIKLKGYKLEVTEIASRRIKSTDVRRLNANGTTICPLCERPEDNPNIAPDDIVQQDTTKDDLEVALQTAISEDALSVSVFSFDEFSQLPSVVPSSQPSILLPSAVPSSFPSAFPSQVPSTVEPTTNTPSELPSLIPSQVPSTEGPTTNTPSDLPSLAPSQVPSTEGPTTDIPSELPSLLPSQVPSAEGPTIDIPSELPSELPSLVPSQIPSTEGSGTDRPSELPSMIPSQIPSTEGPGSPGTGIPSELPSELPSLVPSQMPSTEGAGTDRPSELPSLVPSQIPSTDGPGSPGTDIPSEEPSLVPSQIPSTVPTPDAASLMPSLVPSEEPSSEAPVGNTPPVAGGTPSTSPSTQQPSNNGPVPTLFPTDAPSARPSTTAPIASPSPVTVTPAPSELGGAGPIQPTSEPSTAPTLKPSEMPAPDFTLRPTMTPTAPAPSTTLPVSPKPTETPSLDPITASPTDQPSPSPVAGKDSPAPTLVPTPIPTSRPTPRPTPQPTTLPTPLPTPLPSQLPTCAPLQEFSGLLSLRLNVDPNSLGTSAINSLEDVIMDSFGEGDQDDGCGGSTRRKLGYRKVLTVEYIGLVNTDNRQQLGYRITYEARSQQKKMKDFTKRLNSHMRRAFPVRLVLIYKTTFVDDEPQPGPQPPQNPLLKSQQCRCEQSTEFLYTGDRNENIPVDTSGRYFVDGITVLPLGSSQCGCNGTTRLRHRQLWANIFQNQGGVGGSQGASLLYQMVANKPTSVYSPDPDPDPAPTNIFDDKRIQIVETASRPDPPATIDEPPTNTSPATGNNNLNIFDGGSSTTPKRRKRGQRWWRRWRNRRWRRNWRQRQQDQQQQGSQPFFLTNTADMTQCRQSGTYDSPKMFSC